MKQAESTKGLLATSEINENPNRSSTAQDQCLIQ